jgi:hypothetical protein
MRLIAVEGPDGAGKSTLVKKLSESLGREVIHTGGPPKNKDEWVQRMMNIRAIKDDKVIIDRIPHVSEQIYGPLYERDQVFDNPDFLDRELLEINPVVIYCRLALADEMLTHMSRETKAHKPQTHFDLVISHFGRIVNAYDSKFQSLKTRGLQVRQFDWSRDDYDTLLEFLQCAA